MPRTRNSRIEKPLAEFVFIAIPHPNAGGKPQWREVRTEENLVVIYRPSVTYERLFGEKVVGTKVTCLGFLGKRITDPFKDNSVTHCQVLVKEILKIEPPTNL